uniref:Uncharacterized protein n=1 Tax=Rhizophora mucronata TaxID=61149 RepID=A0A2P2QQN9_RHIMU
MNLQTCRYKSRVFLIAPSNSPIIFIIQNQYNCQCQQIPLYLIGSFANFLSLSHVT